ncbi:hypothetical protein LCGC14_1594350 [marine sediment metagenome]|uniref:Uncharacterized protein n=1 Tax=marine sediment metagenome TaxID=412755 RepID=A0A0F9IZD1_9ZZZZ
MGKKESRGLNETHNILILVPDLPNGPASGAGRNENMKELPELKSYYAGMSKGYVIREKKGDFPFTASEAGEIVRRCKAYPEILELLRYFYELPSRGIHSSTKHNAKLDEAKQALADAGEKQ